jgi:hypothetical protein
LEEDYLEDWITLNHVEQMISQKRVGITFAEL